MGPPVCRLKTPEKSPQSPMLGFDGFESGIISWAHLRLSITTRPSDVEDSGVQKNAPHLERKIHHPRVQIVPPISQGLTEKTAQSLVKHQPISYDFPIISPRNPAGSQIFLLGLLKHGSKKNDTNLKNARFSGNPFKITIHVPLFHPPTPKKMGPISSPQSLRQRFFHVDGSISDIGKSLRNKKMIRPWKS